MGNNETIKEENKKEKINFAKKIYYSVTKLNKYDEMIDEGVRSSLKYLVIIITIIAMFPSIFSFYDQNKKENEIADYIDKNLLNINFSNNELSTENDEVCILNGNEITNNLRYSIVIDIGIENTEDAKNKYSYLVNDKVGCIVFEKEKCEILSYNTNTSSESNNLENININEYSYVDYEKNFIQDNSKEYTKEDVVNYFRNMNLYYYLAQVFITYILILIVVIAVYLIYVISVIIIFSRIFRKNKPKIKKAVPMAIYSITLSNIIYIIYLLSCYIFNISSGFTEIIYMVIPTIYVFILIKKNLVKIK